MRSLRNLHKRSSRARRIRIHQFIVFAFSLSIRSSCLSVYRSSVHHVRLLSCHPFIHAITQGIISPSCHPFTPSLILQLTQGFIPPFIHPPDHSCEGSRIRSSHHAWKISGVTNRVVLRIACACGPLRVWVVLAEFRNHLSHGRARPVLWVAVDPISDATENGPRMLRSALAHSCVHGLESRAASAPCSPRHGGADEGLSASWVAS